MTFQGLYDIRDFTPDDTSFICATFLRGIFYGNSFFSDIPKNIFMAHYKKVVQGALNNPNVVIKVACLKEDPNVILGYSIISKDQQAVIWVFVKTAWRQQGIGRSLLPQAPRFVTHLTELGRSLLPKLEGAVFNPFF
jgi:hypothetical protein